MCGIAGLVDKKSTYSYDEKRHLISQMLQKIKHRGPDGDGIVIEKNVAIAQARLSVIDLSSAGLQPMWNEKKDVALSVNGEIYNYPALRRILETKYRYLSHSDSESLLHAYEEWGATCIEKCKGMFAFSILDLRNRTVFLAVDRFSIKPLYYIDTPEWFAWSSEVKALLVIPGIKAMCNENVLGEYLMFRSIADRETLFKGIYKALPGESITFSLQDTTPHRRIYWEPSSVTQPVSLEQIEDLFYKSIEEHMLADVPLGVQLSGGLDSSFVSAAVRKKMPEGTRLHSFSIGLVDERWNEFPYSRDVASLLSTFHHELVFTEEDFCRTLPLATYHYDEPLNHTHSIPMMMLAEEAKKHVTVLLSGEGADEIFSGYLRYLLMLKDGIGEADLTFSNAFVTDEGARALAPGLDIDLTYRKKILSSSKDMPRRMQLARYDLATYVPPLLLRQDKMGMKSGLENRVPYLDHELAEAAMSSLANLGEDETKTSLKRIAEQLLPKEIVHRKKVGFSQPLAEWLRNERGLGAFLTWFQEREKRHNFFDYDAINRCIEEHVSGKADNAQLLWILVSFEAWSRIFIDGIEPATLSEEWEAIARDSSS